MIEPRFVSFVGGPLDGSAAHRRTEDVVGARRFVPFPTLGAVLSGQVSLHDERTKFGVASYVLEESDGEALYIFEEPE